MEHLATFSIAIHDDKMDTIITHQPFIIIQHSYTWHKRTDHIYIADDAITNRFIIHQLMNIGLYLDPAYCIIGFNKIKDTLYGYKICIGLK